METPETEIKRLVKMQGSDEGFYVVAAHAFIEGVLALQYPDFNPDYGASFKENLFGYKNYLIEHAGGRHVKGLEAFERIRWQRELTNRIRHAFDRATAADVAAATSNLCDFARAAGLQCPEFAQLNQSLDIWKDRRNRTEIVAELQQMREQLAKREAQGQEWQKKLEAYQTTQEVLKHQKNQLALREAQIQELKSSGENRKARYDELRQERNQWRMDLRETRRQMEGMQEQKDYLRNLLHLTLYTRTRMDYERSLRQLTAEQKSVLDTISLKSDFLIKGGAGTGKTLVLLEALRKVNQNQLGLEERQILLLTYTRTLVRYDQYLSKLMELHPGDQGNSPIQTADSFFNGLVGLHLGLTVDYKLLKQLVKPVKHSVLSQAQLQTELQDFIYAQGVTQEEYLDQMISRRGLKVPLNRPQREEVWALKEKLEHQMLEKKTVCRGFSRVLLAQWLEEHPEDLTERPDYIFIDEAQDLFSLELKILKSIARQNLIMAGDSDQTIYGLQSPYKRADIDVKGHTRILKHNYRNTLPIHDLAEGFRLIQQPDKEIRPAAFRDGPPPELYTADSTEELYHQLTERVKVFTNLIDYDPENICILAPQSVFLGKISEHLEAAGFRTAVISDQGFSFSDKGAVRLSTLHASKGLDLPVTLLFLPKLFPLNSFSDEAAEKQLRNLLYVAMTRAMEHLNVFTKAGDGGAVLEDLRRVFSTQ